MTLESSSDQTSLNHYSFEKRIHFWKYISHKTFPSSLSMTMFYSIDLLLETELETVNWQEECHLVTVTPSVEQEPNSDRHIHSQGDKKWSAYYIHYTLLFQTQALPLLDLVTDYQRNIHSHRNKNLSAIQHYIRPPSPLNPYMIPVGQIWSPNNVLHIYFITSDSFTQKYETCDRLAQQLVF